MRTIFLCCFVLLFLGLKVNSQNSPRNIMVTGFWNPTGQMISHFSSDTVLNPYGWEGENWSGLGFNVHSFFPKPGVYTGELEVDYQNVLEDLYRIADSIKPIAIVSFGAGAGPWEIENGARNCASWIADYESPYYPIPNPPDSTIGNYAPRYSTIPVYDIKEAVNNETNINAYVDMSNDLGRFICEYTCFLGNWYRDLNFDSENEPCLQSGFIHVKSNIAVSSATKAANITVRETAESLLSEIMNVSGYITFADTNQTAIGTTISFEGQNNYSTQVTSLDGRYTIPFIEPGNYYITVNQGDNYKFDSINVVIDSTKQINVHFEKFVGVEKDKDHEFTLAQNYPNPFNESTTIGFNMLSKAKVKLSIFDISGREVKVLTNKNYEPGYHTITWNAENNYMQKVLPGLYIYQLETNGKKVHKQCIFIK